MTKKNTVVLTFVYPGVEKYLDDFFYSLSIQTYSLFDIYVYNDGCKIELLANVIKKFKDNNIIVRNIDQKYTPAKIREIAIRELASEYDYLVFADSDDFFSENRIEKSIEVLREFDFCYNDMYLVASNGVRLNLESYFEKKSNPIIVNEYEQLLDMNFCGLSNTSINLQTISFDNVHIPSSLIAVDWWIFSMLLIKGYTGCFIKDAFTYYRQHSENTVGGFNIIDRIQLQKGIQIKMEHYSLMLRYYPSEYNKIIKNRYDSIIMLDKYICDCVNLEKYISNVMKEQKDFLWWENIQYLERWI